MKAIETKRNEKERFNTENEIRFESPENTESAKAIIPCTRRATYGGPILFVDLGERLGEKAVYRERV
jgi:hypothetical protein